MDQRNNTNNNATDDDDGVDVDDIATGTTVRNDDVGGETDGSDNNNDEANDRRKSRKQKRRRVTTSPLSPNRNNGNNDTNSLQDSPTENESDRHSRNNSRAERLVQLSQRRRLQLIQESSVDQNDENDINVNVNVERVERKKKDRRRRRSSRTESTDNNDNTNDFLFAGEGEVDQQPRGPRHRDVTATDDNDDDLDDGIDNDEVDVIVDDGNNDDVEEEDDGEDLMENMDRDYQRIEALDTYGTEGIDDTDYDAIDGNQREIAEREMARRDRELGGRGRRADGFYGLLHGDDDVDNQEDADARIARRGMFDKRRKRRDGGSDDDDDDDPDDDQQDGDNDDASTDEEDLDGDDLVNLEAFDVPLQEWIAMDHTRKEIQRRFRKFVRHYRLSDSMNTDNQPVQRRRTGSGNGLYEQKIRAMCAANLSSIQISYDHIMDYEPIIAYWLADAPSVMLIVLNEAITRHTLMLFPSYNNVLLKREVHVRIINVPIMDSLRDLRHNHLNCLVKVHGVITRRSTVFPQLHIAYYSCMNCKNTQGPFRIHPSGNSNNNAQSNGNASGAMNENAAVVGNGNNNPTQPEVCNRCNIPGVAFRLHPTLSQYRNMQRLNLQESPGTIPPGRVPRSKEVILMDDLIDTLRPGEDAEVTGVYEHTFDASLTIKSGFPVFNTTITANYICRKEDALSSSNLSEQDIKQILELSRDPKIGERIVKSIAPSIYGHETIKMALAMSLFGGVPKNISDKHPIRGDINVLLLGDPGTAKSQFLKYAQKTAPRAVYSTGKGASAVGLTAAVQKDPITKEWTLEGGALVLADQGVCLIDEFDKMNEQDRTSIHEAMEQQSISVSKAGIVTSLQARCSVIAAANPIGGRYDSSITLSDNVELTDPILQRFDILCVLQDTIDVIADERLANFVTTSHMRSIPTNEIPANNNNIDLVHLLPEHIQQQIAEERQNESSKIIPQQLLRKYIQYARMNIKPVLRSNAFDKEKVSSLYVALRRESASSGGVPIAVRHVESIMRMAEAHAKMHLREYVRDDDMNGAIQVMLTSFIDSQKFSVKRSLRRSLAKYITASEDKAHLLLHILQDMFRKEQLYQVIRQRQQQVRDGGGGTGGVDPSTQLDVSVLEVPLDEFESRARERRIFDVIEFCTKSNAFQEAGFWYNEKNRTILRSIDQVQT